MNIVLALALPPQCSARRTWPGHPDNKTRFARVITRLTAVVNLLGMDSGTRKLVAARGFAARTLLAKGSCMSPMTMAPRLVGGTSVLLHSRAHSSAASLNLRRCCRASGMTFVRGQARSRRGCRARSGRNHSPAA